MFLADFDFELPDELIAREPARERRGSRLLVVDHELGDRGFEEFPELLRPGDLLVLNDTRVVKARLRGRKATGGSVELLIERPLDARRALAQVRASKSPKAGTTIALAGGPELAVLGRQDNLFEIGFPDDLETILEHHGEVPLPPYIDRQPADADEDRYQTVYAKHPGAVAAPTAGLHLDEQMLAGMNERGVRVEFVTLHVGAGTFQPLRAERVDDNRLHSERVEVTSRVCDAVHETRAAGGRVVAVGTTSVRALEAASSDGVFAPLSGETDIFIRPGYRFQSVDMLLTNFHLPQSSLLMLVSAFAGRTRILDAYRHAVAARYRFFSYGDAMLLFPETAQ